VPYVTGKTALDHLLQPAEPWWEYSNLLPT